VRAVFTGATKKGQGQAVTFLVRHLGRSPDEIRTALGELVKAGEIYVRPHMRGQLYYLTGEGPGPVPGKK
jgi:DNA-binding transcriptional regulator PaaX